MCLLQPEFESVDFHPEAEGFLSEIIEWVVNKDTKTALKILTGGAGFGKTRSMIEVCSRMSDEGWKVGFLADVDIDASVKAISNYLSQSRSSILLVIDYAETRTSDVSKILKSMNDANSSKLIRLVLVARNTGSWWYELMLRDKQLRLLINSESDVPNFGKGRFFKSKESKYSMFFSALDAYAKLLGIKTSNTTAFPSYLCRTNTTPLYLHLAALATLKQEQPTTFTDLLAYTITREKAYWFRIFGSSAESVGEKHYQFIQ